MDIPKALNEIAQAVDGKIEEIGVLPDSSGYALMTMPLRKDHWIYGDRSCERQVGELMTCRYEPPPMVVRMGAKDMLTLKVSEGRILQLDKEQVAEIIRRAGRYAVRAATMKGTEMDFDPDAMIQNLVVGFLGYWTEDGYTETGDEWANPIEEEL